MTKQAKKQAMLKALQEFEGVVNGDSAFLFASGIVGPNADRIHKWVGDGLFTRREAREWGNKARKFGIWTKNNKLSVEWLEEHGWVAFVCDLMTIRGLLERVRADN